MFFPFSVTHKNDFTNIADDVRFNISQIMYIMLGTKRGNVKNLVKSDRRCRIISKRKTRVLTFSDPLFAGASTKENGRPAEK